MPQTVSAIIFTVLTGIVIIFQGCLAAGVPWGAASMGGKYPGKYPPKMRVVAVINIIVLALINVIVLSRADLLFPFLRSVSNIAIWFIVVLFALSTVMNTITRSKIERIWAPVAFLQLATSLFVAIS